MLERIPQTPIRPGRQSPSIVQFDTVNFMLAGRRISILARIMLIGPTRGRRLTIGCCRGRCSLFQVYLVQGGRPWSFSCKGETPLLGDRSSAAGMFQRVPEDVHRHGDQISSRSGLWSETSGCSTTLKARTSTLLLMST